MTLELVFRPAARVDLETLEDYISRDSPARARAYVQRIVARCERLTQFPEAGRRRDDLRPGLRLAPFERRVVIAYRVTTQAVEIGRVFYGGRDVDTLLAEEPSDV